MSVFLTMIASILDILNQQISADLITIGMWGDSELALTETWTDILCPANNCDAQDCIHDAQTTKFVTGVKYEIFYEKTGNVIAPQPKVCELSVI